MNERRPKEARQILSSSIDVAVAAFRIRVRRVRDINDDQQTIFPASMAGFHQMYDFAEFMLKLS